MSKKLVYSAKPGQIMDEEGNQRPTYLGKPKSTVRNFDKYGNREFSEKRRKEIRREFEIKSLIKTFNREIKAEINLVKQIKK